MSKNGYQKLGQLLRHAKDNNERFYFFIGAGCSKTAGIPLAKEFVQEINDDQGFEYDLEDLDDKSKKDYGRCMEAIHKQGRKSLIKKYVDNSKVNWGHIALSLLMQQGYAQRVLSFNFDNVLTRACSLLGFHPAVYDFTGADPKFHNMIADPCIVHLHGQSDGFEQLHTPLETQNSAEKQRVFVREMFNQAHCVFIGYSGLADSFFDVIKTEYRAENRLFWVDLNDDTPKHVKDHLESKYSVAKYIKCKNSDHFLVELTKELKIHLPPFLDNPYQHLLGELEQITDYPGKWQDDMDVMASVKSQLESDAVNHNNRVNIESLWVDENYDAIIAILEKNPPKSDKELHYLYWAYQSKAFEVEDIKNYSSEELNKAFSYYEKAIAVKSNGYEAHYNWAIALKTLATRTESISEAKPLFEKAFGHYEQAIKIKPDYHYALNNWGLALKGLATRTASITEAKPLFEKAIKRYQQAIKIKPDFDEALNNLGVALMEFAEHTESIAQTRPIFEQAIEHYKRAYEIKPDRIEAINNHIDTLTTLANRVDDAEKPALYEEALLLAQKVESINPDEVYNYACLLSLTDDFDGAKEKLLRCEKAGTLPDKKHLKSDPDLKNLQELDWFKELLERTD